MTCRRLRTKRRNKFACSKISSSMSAMLFALIFPRAQCASTYDISAERNVWLQSALRSFAIVCDYMETGLFAIVCDPRSSAIVCDHMETSLKPTAVPSVLHWKKSSPLKRKAPTRRSPSIGKRPQKRKLQRLIYPRATPRAKYLWSHRKLRFSRQSQKIWKILL